MARGILIWGIIGLMLVVAVVELERPTDEGARATMPYSEFIRSVTEHQISEVTTSTDTVLYERAGMKYRVRVPVGAMPETERQLRLAGVRVGAEGAVREGVAELILSAGPPLLLLGAFLFFLWRQRLQSRGAPTP